MTVSSRPALASTIVAVLLMVSCGCGGSTEPTAKTQDELTEYLDAHPELKDVKEDTVTATGGT